MAKALYICYFGLRQPLVQTQVLPYLRELLKDGHSITLLTFEPDFKNLWTADQVGAERKNLRDSGIEWHCLPYHKWPSAIATAYDIFRGAWFVRSIIADKGIDILHGRVHVPTLMGALARKFSRRKPELLFDIRGFFPEEYTDAGIWPEDGMLYRSAKRIEKWLMKEADGFVVLTEKARQILFSESLNTSFDKMGRPVEVIPCCVDFRQFPSENIAARSEMRKKLNVEDRKVLAYVGSFGGWYLTNEMLDFFTTARESDSKTFALILTQRDKEAIVQRLYKKGFADSDFLVETVPPSEIAGYLSAADSAISFIKACYSKLSSSPTKIAEYLACGLPIIANSGVGDVDALINENRVGVLIPEFSREAYLQALAAVSNLGDVNERCRETAVREFDLGQVGGERYRRIYRRLSEKK